MKGRGRDEGNASHIREAAKQLFIEKGYDGTTMQAIADASGVNKALLHYYFESKDKLFLLIFRHELAELSDSMATLWDGDGKPLGQRFEDWIDALTAFISRAPHLPLFIVAEMTRNPELIKGLLAEFLPPSNILALAEGEPAPGGGVTLPAFVELVGVVYSLIVFPVLAAPMIHHLLGVDSPLLDELMASQTRLAKEVVHRRLDGQAPP
ncbi:MAG: TetR/AcrR family transcriptional regulator [Spirochaetota bacterium]